VTGEYSKRSAVEQRENEVANPNDEWSDSNPSWIKSSSPALRGRVEVFENSPAIYGWVNHPIKIKSPAGTKEIQSNSC
jgi:hypothetical protein